MSSFLNVGFVLQASVIMVTGFWLAHVLHMFYSLAFPFRALRFMASHSATRRVHLIEVFVVITLGLLSSVIIISTSGYRFIGFPQTCASGSAAGYFYAQLLPLTIGVSIGMLILSTSVMIVRNVSYSIK